MRHSLLFLLLFVCLLSSCGVRDNEVASVYKSGTSIVFCLGEYYMVNGEYPESLDSLIPEYLDEIPGTGWGTNKWRYTKMEGEYILSAPMNELCYPIVIFSKGKWIIDQ